MSAVPNRCSAAVLLAGLLSTLTSFTTAPAKANDRDPRATPVSGASCAEIARATPNNPWSSASYFSVGGPSQFLKLRCPLPLNSVDLSGTTNDNDISKLRVHYVDQDGFGTAASVVVELVRTSIPASGGILPESAIVCSWTSNVDGTGATTPVKATKACVQDLAAEAFYHFEVSLSSSSPAHAVAFLGVTFP